MCIYHVVSTHHQNIAVNKTGKVLALEVYNPAAEKDN